MVGADSGLTKLETTPKGLIFLKKYFEIQQFINAKDKHKAALHEAEIKIPVAQQSTLYNRVNCRQAF